MDGFGLIYAVGGVLCYRCACSSVVPLYLVADALGLVVLVFCYFVLDFVCLVVVVWACVICSWCFGVLPCAFTVGGYVGCDGGC